MRNSEPVFIDIAEGNFKRGIFNAIIAPRPIGWMSTIDAEGCVNLAPYSYFNIMSNDPPVLVFSCNTPEDRPSKDTLKNVRETGEFVFNLVSYELVHEMNMTSSPLPPGADEFEHAGLEKAACKFVKPPRVARSPVSLECKVINTLKITNDVGGPEVNVTFGRVVGMHIQAGYLEDDGHFLTDLARPVTRLGGAEYAISQPAFNLARQFTRANENTY
ncbi:flavin reductase (DIM6/NTAB) family NADH-FMN oxidoreductase RutF [Mesorhizobium soli]|uniref:flavin reductase family protein n=1 Tax=Pseudaminobacter soli (ex Li et al. 2025) TaxID=1295366 RepID=UPI002476729A|nr:flavin reductase family protein [Mesorhizobium soli]MDH6232215.1 flavin reductase (DIM6/NTAB) family NADH-FMN oxidoreductase RutF [Mesorhizobium soli]